MMQPSCVSPQSRFFYLCHGILVLWCRVNITLTYVFLGQVAADANTAGQVYPDQSLYPADSVPNLVRRINKALQRADQVWPLPHNSNGLSVSRRTC